LVDDVVQPAEGPEGNAAPEARELALRPVRPADRERILEITADVWEGHDYLPEVLDAWLANPGATFQAAELEGVLVGVQRLRPIAPRIVFYEGLRVASSHQRRGVGRAMLRYAVRTARSLGFSELRLITGNPQAARLFDAEGFRLLTELAFWRAGRLEGGELPRLAPPSEAPQLAALLRDDPGLAAYGGVNPDWQGVLDVDAALLERLAGEGRVRTGAGGRSVALLRPVDGGERLPVTFAAGSAGSLQDLLTALRVEADSQDLRGVLLCAPPDHPAAGEIAEVGYDLADEEGHGYCYACDL
jgi:GNAT superfamily N-acetyltransferase